jgi:hypothetical protein
MAQSALAIDYTQENFLDFLSVLNALFYGNWSVKNHEDFVSLLAQAEQLDTLWVNAFYFNGSQVVQAVRGDSGQFLPGDASPFAPQRCNSIICDVDGDDLVVVVRSPSQDFEEVHSVTAWTLEMGQYRPMKYSFVRDGQFCTARIVGGARHRHVFFALVGLDEITDADFTN